MGAVAWAMRQRSVSHPRSSNRACGFPASGSPTGFIVRRTKQITDRKRHLRQGMSHELVMFGRRVSCAISRDDSEPTAKQANYVGTCREGGSPGERRDQIESEIRDLFRGYRGTLGSDLRALLDQFRYVDQLDLLFGERPHPRTPQDDHADSRPFARPAPSTRSSGSMSCFNASAHIRDMNDASFQRGSANESSTAELDRLAFHVFLVFRSARLKWYKSVEDRITPLKSRFDGSCCPCRSRACCLMGVKYE